MELDSLWSMTDEFVEYVNREGINNFHISDVNKEIQLWGSREGDDVSLKGISYHCTDRWSESDHESTNRLRCVVDLASKAGVPCIWIGGFDLNWRDLAGHAEVGTINEVDGTYKFDGRIVDISPFDDTRTGSSELEQALQSIMGTSLIGYYNEDNHSKSVNKGTTPVQDWVRTNMPREFVVIDIDLLVGDGSGTPQHIVEIRRSDWPKSDKIHGWWPWYSDHRNYYLVAAAANSANVGSVLVQHEKGHIDDTDTIGYYTGLQFKSHNRINERYPDEATARKWLEFDVDYPSVEEAIRRLK